MSDKPRIVLMFSLDGTDDIQVYNFNRTQLHNLVKKIQTEGLSIHHDQEFTEAQIIEFSKRIGECGDRFVYESRIILKYFRSICKDEQGNKLGMFGGGELG